MNVSNEISNDTFISAKVNKTFKISSTSELINSAVIYPNISWIIFTFREYFIRAIFVHRIRNFRFALHYIGLFNRFNYIIYLQIESGDFANGER